MHSNSLPTFFVPHGSPMFALDRGETAQRLAGAAQLLPDPVAIVIISPHWETREPTVGSAVAFDTIHDFHGFDRQLYSLSYPAFGLAAAAEKVAGVLRTSGFDVGMDAERGLDHGAWVPLMHMFPRAHIPIVSLSIQHHLGPEHAYRVGQALYELRHHGFLIVGSGNITHNLNDFRDAMRTSASTPSYVHKFSDWVAEQLAAADINALLNYRTLEPSGQRAHPRDEHLLPLFTALGAAGQRPQAQAFYRGISDVVLAMDGYVFH